uniref:DDE Tnp4 domain-containing protein n=1 Tax=Strigamia maritima TaxID=126957 RepID=T1JDQ6_STRMM
MTSVVAYVYKLNSIYLSGRWRIFQRPIKANVETIDVMVKACVCLHNYLMTNELGLPRHKHIYNPVGMMDEDDSGNVVMGQWRETTRADTGLQNLGRRVGSNRCSNDASLLRDQMAEYFFHVQIFPWQAAYVNRSS